MNLPEPATAGRKGTESEVGSVFVSNYPPFSTWSGDQVEHARAALQAPPRPDADFGLYLHIPFCRKRCKFCYFRVYTDKNYDEIGTYLDAMAREVELYSQLPAVRGRKPKFVYFGGGTPSYINPKQLRVLVQRARDAFPWDEVEEVTFECEPGTLTQAKLEAIKEVGVTRLSLGIEHFDDDILRENGRAHVSKEIFRALPWIRQVGFEQLNIDLIAGMIGETEEKWREAVQRTVELEPDSITIYQLELPFNTRFTKSLLNGELDVPVADWDTKRRWHSHAIDELTRAGYEVSSGYTMVKNKETCRFVYRNSVWRGCDLLGMGVASFSHISGVHFQNLDGWGEYLAKLGAGELPLGRARQTSDEERLTREMILQLKLGRIGSGYFRDKFGVDILERYAQPFAKLEERGMLRVLDDGIELSRQGLLRVDTLLPEFYDERYRGARYT
jgi:oxygen-independent coproporphyrinogen-3 oxidase